MTDTAEHADQVELVARAMCVALGLDPDELRTATGYENSQIIPRWYVEVEWARRHIAAHTVLSNTPAA